MSKLCKTENNLKSGKFLLFDTFCTPCLNDKTVKEPRAVLH